MKRVSLATAYTLVISLVVVGATTAAAATSITTPALHAPTASVSPMATHTPRESGDPKLGEEQAIVGELVSAEEASARLDTLLETQGQEARRVNEQAREAQVPESQRSQGGAPQRVQAAAQQRSSADRTTAKPDPTAEARRRAEAEQAETNRRIQEALEALARALSTSECTTVGGTNGELTSISCPWESAGTNAGEGTTGSDSTDDTTADEGSVGAGTTDGAGTTGDDSTADDTTGGDPSADTMVAASAPETPVAGAGLTQGQLDKAVAAALVEWAAAGAHTSGVSASVADLPGLTLGRADGNAIVVDADAGGWGWGVNFPADAPALHMDLLTVVRHEVGHVLGLGHGDSGLMAESLSPGSARAVESPAQPTNAVATPAESTTETVAEGQGEGTGAGTDETGAQSDTEPAVADEAVTSGTDSEGVADAADSSDTDAAATGTNAAGADATGTAVTAGTDTGPAATEPPASGPSWTVENGVATLSTDGANLHGTLSYTPETGVLTFTSVDGHSAELVLDGTVRLAVRGSAGDDEVTVDLKGVTTALTVDVDGAAGDDVVIVPEGSGTATYSATGDFLRISHGSTVIRSRNVEMVLDLAPRDITVTGTGSDLQVTTSGESARVLVTGLVARAVLAFGAPLVAALLDAGAGEVTLTGEISWSETGADLVIRGQNVEVTAGSSIVTGDGAITLQATDTATNGGSNAAASVTITGANISGGDMVISATSTVNLSATGSQVAVTGSSTATVTVRDSRLESSGDISLQASSDAVGKAVAEGNAAHTSTGSAAASASVVLSSTSVVEVGGSTTVEAAGDLTLHATNHTDATAIGNASGATAGAGIATAVVDRVTRAFIDGASAEGLTAASLNLLAEARGDVTVSSTSSSGGATGNDISPDSQTDGMARTIDGFVPVPAALGFGRISGLTEAYLSSGPGQLLTIRTTHGQRVEATGDSGLLVLADASSSQGQGVAAAVALSELETRAFLAGDLSLEGPEVMVSADAASARSEATAVAGSRSSTGPVGALAVDVARIDTSASLAPSANLSVSGAGPPDISFVSKSGATSAASARGPAPNLVVLVVDHSTSSTLDDGSSLTGAGGLTLSATTDDNATASAAMDGGPGSAVTLSTVTTKASLGAGPALELSGDLVVEGRQSASASTSAPVVALTLAEHNVEATTGREVTAGGTVRFEADGTSRTSTVTAPASSQPAVTAGEAVEAVRDLADAVAADNASGSASTVLPATGPAPVRPVASTVASTVAITATTATADAVLPVGLPIRSEGPLDVLATSVVSASASAGGSVGAGPATSGPAIAVILVTSTGRATASVEAVTAGDLTVRASRGPPGAGDPFSAAAPTYEDSTAPNLGTHSTTATAPIPQMPAFQPPAGSILISAASRGTLTLGSVTLTIPASALPVDAPGLAGDPFFTKGGGDCAVGRTDGTTTNYAVGGSDTVTVAGLLNRAGDLTVTSSGDGDAVSTTVEVTVSEWRGVHRQVLWG